MSEIRPVDFWEGQVLPRLFAELDRVFPEFGFRRTRKGWEAMPRACDPSILGLLGVGNAGRIFCNESRKQMFAAAGAGRGIHWCAYVLGRAQTPRGKDFVEAVAMLAERVGVDPSPLRRAPTTDEERARWAREAEEARRLVEAHRARAEAEDAARRSLAIKQAREVVGAAWRSVTDPDNPEDQRPLELYRTKVRGRDVAKMPGGQWPSGAFFARTKVRGRPCTAVFVPVLDAGNQLIGCQRIFVTRLGEPYEVEVQPGKKTRKAALGAMSGGAARIGDELKDGVLVLCEGRETGEAIHEATGYMVWPCISTSGLKSIELPKDMLEQIRAVVIAGDCDGERRQGDRLWRPGQEAAQLAAERIRRIYRLAVATAIPSHKLAPQYVSADGVPLGDAHSFDWEDAVNKLGSPAVRMAFLEAQARADSGPAPDNATPPHAGSSGSGHQGAGDVPASPGGGGRGDAGGDDGPPFGPDHEAFDHNDPEHWRAAIRMGNWPSFLRHKKRDEKGYVREPYAPVMPTNDLDAAHEYLLAHHAPAVVGPDGGGLHLVCLNGERMYRWEEGVYVEYSSTPERTLGGNVRRHFHDHCKFKPTRESPPGANFVDADLSKTTINGIASAVVDEINVVTPVQDYRQQFWIRPNITKDVQGRPEIVKSNPAWLRRVKHPKRENLPDPELMLTIRNGLFDLDAWLNRRELILHPHTPTLFSTGIAQWELPIEEARAALKKDGIEGLREFGRELCPDWWAYLMHSFAAKDGEDAEEAAEVTARELHKVIGNLMTLDLHWHQGNIVWLNGPPGFGKSKTPEVIEALLGETNCISSRVSQLEGNFHLHSWLHARAAIFHEMDPSGRQDKKQFVEFLKMVATGNKMTIDRKHLDEIRNFVLRTRILIVCNQIPPLPDATTALQRRSICFDYRNPIPKEKLDLRLLDKLTAPRSLAGVGILSLCGLVDLREEGFVQPKWSAGPLEDLKDQGSPYESFVEDCLLIADGEWVAIEDLWKVLSVHAEQNGRSHIPPAQQVVGELKPMLIMRGWVSRKKNQQGGRNGYAGVGLSERGKAMLTPPSEGDKPYQSAGFLEGLN